MKTPINRNVTIEATKSHQIEIYCASSALGARIGKLSPKAHLYLDILEDYMNGAIFQYHRIHNAQDVGHIISFSDYSKQKSSTGLEARFFKRHIAINDVHYYTICIDKIDKLYPKLLSELASIHSRIRSSEVKHKKSLATNLLRRALAPAVRARQYLEHIVKEMVAGNFGGFGIHTGMSRSTFSFASQDRRLTLELGDLVEIQHAYEALVSYIDAVCNLESVEP